MEINEGEQVYFNVMANLFRGAEAVGGRLKITDESLYFKAHKLNVQTQPLALSLRQVVDVRKRNTLGFVPNGLSIFTEDGKEYKFVLWNRKKIMTFIKSKMKL